MRISVTSNIKDSLGFLDRLSDQAPFAIAVALTKTAVDVQKEIYQVERTAFDRPTSYTLNSMYVRKATKRNLVASVELKDRLLSKTQRGHDRTIGHQFTGGQREHKSIERYAQRAGLISSHEYLVPSAAARLDAYGNMSRGQVAQVMSQLRIGIDQYQYATKSKRSKAHQKKAGLVFWSRGGHLQRGVWLRTRGGVEPLLMVEGSVRYRQRINVDAIGMRVADRVFSNHLDTAWQKAIATAR